MYRNQLVDNNTYNILQAFVSTLEALEVYQKYSQDGNEQLWKEVASHTEQVAQILARHLPQVMQGSQAATASQSGNYGATGSQSGQMGNYGTTGQTGQSGMYGTGNQPPR